MTNATAKAKWEADNSSVELCSWHEELGKLDPDALIPYGVWTLDDIKAYGIRHGVCPYFAVRRMVRPLYSPATHADEDIAGQSIGCDLLLPLSPRPQGRRASQ